ncbi:MAG: hypothetical protein JWO36_3355 [Myxococcales bacterium]|nr:hypothetical protein [Myxococcales bacterium]
MGEQIRSVLVADDDELLLRSFQRLSPSTGIIAHTATNRESALCLAREHRPQLAIVDLQLGADNGLDLLRDLRVVNPTMLLVLLTGYSSVQTAVAAMRLGAFDVVPKPCSLKEIMQRLGGNSQGSAPVPLETPSLERAVWEHVHRVLADCGGNKSEAARRLNKPRSWLRRALSRRAPKN